MIQIREDAMRGFMLETVLGLLRQTSDGEGPVTDAQLLYRYCQRRDELAFTELVRRHGPMVLGVCRRLLRDRQAAEDAFQATFLVLVRRARSVRWHDSIAGWLHEVACRTARKARSRPALVPAAIEDISMLTTSAEQDIELGEVLDDALASLPSHYRNVLLLCCEEGKTEEQAAGDLGCALGTVKSRLARARALLRKRLERRGVVVPAGAALWLSGTRSAEAVPAELLRSVVGQGMAFAGGPALRTPAALLAQSVLRGFRLARVRACVYLIACVGLAIVGGMYALGGLGPPSLADRQTDRIGPEHRTTGRTVAFLAEKGTAESPERPLPAGVVRRLGTTRFRPGGMLAYLSLSTDGKHLISIGPGIALWDAETGRRVMHIPRTPVCSGVELSSDGKRLLVNESVRDTSVLKVYAVPGGKVLKVIEGPRSIACFALSSDQRTVALQFITATTRLDRGFSYRSHLELRNLATDRVLRTFGVDEIFAPFGWLRFSEDGKTLFAISAMRPSDNRSVVRRFDVTTAALRSKMVIDGVHYATRLVSDRKMRIVAGGKVWDLAKGIVWAGKPDTPPIYCLLPGGKTAVVGVAAKNGWVQDANGGSVREIAPAYLALWDLKADREIRRYPGRFPDSNIVLSHDGKTCYTTSGVFGVITRWSLADGRDVQPVDAPRQAPRWLTFSPNGKQLAAVDQEALHVWDCVTGKRLHHQSLDPQRSLRLLRFTPDGRHLLMGGAGGVIALDTVGWKQIKHALPGLPFGIPDSLAAELSPDGKTLAVSPGPVTLWDWARGKMTGTLARADRGLRQGGAAGFSADGPVAFSADGKWLASAATPFKPGQTQPVPPRMQVWSLADRKLVRDWATSELHLLAIHFTPDGKSLVGGFHNGTVCVWDTVTGKEKLRFKHAVQGPTNIWVRVSLDGKLVATADYSGNPVRFWDLATGKQVGQFAGTTGLVEGMQFSPDGALLAVSGTNTTVLIVDVRQLNRLH
jgi:RNA polymerase sigma factor (sigma-70 family)